MKNPIIVNPESNPELASYLTDIVKDFTSSFPCTRDNCGHINRELMTELIMEGETPTLIYGLYRVDSYLGWLDEEDFTDEELAQIEKEYGGNNRYSLEKFVRSLPEREQEQYLYIPHYFLLLDGLILDAASDMFQTENSPDRYFTDEMIPVLDSI